MEEMGFRQIKNFMTVKKKKVLTGFMSTWILARFTQMCEREGLSNHAELLGDWQTVKWIRSEAGSPEFQVSTQPLAGVGLLSDSLTSLWFPYLQEGLTYTHTHHTPYTQE